MKKTSRILWLITALFMMLSLAACGAAPQEAAEPEPEYVYRSAFQPLASGLTAALSAKVFTDGGAYAVCSEKVGREIPETADLENLTEEDLTKFDVYAENIYFIANDGTAKKLPNYKPLEGKENEAGHKDYYSQSGINTLALDGSGNLLVIEYIYTGWYDGPEGKSYTDEDYYDYYKGFQEVYIRTLDSSGAELGCVPIELREDEYYRSSSVADEKGNLLGSVETELRAYSGDGETAYSVECNGYVESIVKLSDGRIYVSLWGDNGLSLVPLDTESATLGKGISLPSDAYSPIAGSGDYDLYYTSGLNFYGYDIETETATALFNWINCDVNSDELSCIRVEDDGTVLAIVNEYDYSGNIWANSLLTVSKVPYDAAAEKETLTLACLSLDQNVRNAVIKFNRSSDSARIEIKDYSEFNTGEDYEAGSQKLLTEIMAGDVPDLLALDSLPYRRIASKGLLEDLYPYIDADTELERSDFFPNILNAMEINGGLYSVCPSFHVAAVMGAVSVVGDRTSWTYDDFDAALAAMPEGCEPFETGVSRSDILRTCLVLDMPDYVDWSTGKCSFESEQFTELLAFSARFPAPTEDVPMDDTDTTQERITSGMQMLLATSIYSLDDALYDCMYFGGKEVCYIGFPTYAGSGNVITTESGFAMSSSCADKNAAWEFLRSFLTQKYQESNVWSIPTNLGAYDAKLAQMMTTSYVLDENGQYKLDENGEKIKEPRYTMSSDNGPIVNVYAMTKEQADEITSVVSAATRFYDYDQSIISIVADEAEAYFAGQKSAEEVAKLIQGKVNIYVNEQS